MYLHLYHLILVSLLCVCCYTSSLSSIWISGCRNYNSFGTHSKYGSEAIISARYASLVWKMNDDLILLGGRALDIYLNDLYKSNDGSNWKWIGGCADAFNAGIYTNYTSYTSWPRGRYYGSSFNIQNSGIYIGFGYESGNYLSDIFHVSSSGVASESQNIFKWVAGCALNYNGHYDSYSSNSWPRSRWGAATWIFPTINYMYGGRCSSGYMNDIHSFNGSSWIWLSGCSTEVYSGPVYPVSYGGTGLPNGRAWSSTWVMGDSMYLFGGSDNTGTTSYNDLWRLNINGNDVLWTFINGCKDVSTGGSYPYIKGNIGLPAARESSPVVIMKNKVYIMNGFSTYDGGRYLLDCWIYDTSLNQFLYQYGNASYYFVNDGIYKKYGAEGRIGGRYSSSLIVKDEKIYLIHGYGKDGNDLSGYLNDIWIISESEDNENEGIVFPFEPVIAGALFLLTLIFIIFNRRLIYSRNVYSDIYYIFGIESFLNLASDILLMIYLLSSELLFILFISVAIFLLSKILNVVLMKKWNERMKSCSNIKDINQYIYTDNHTAYFTLYYCAMILDPSILFFLKTKAFRFPGNEESIALSSNCVFYDFYSVIPQSAILYYLAVLSSFELETFLWIAFILKLCVQIIELPRLGLHLYIGGGRDRNMSSYIPTYRLNMESVSMSVSRIIEHDSLSIKENAQEDPTDINS